MTRLMLAGLAALAATAAPAETLKFAHWVPPAHTLTAAVVDPLVEGVAADTGGSLVIDVYPGGELGAGPLEQYVRVVQGVADIAWGLPGYTSSQFPLTMISELPGAEAEGRTTYDAFYDAWDAGLLAAEFPQTVPLAFWGEPNVFIMRGHEIRSPADVEGLKIRVAGAVTGRLVEAMGGTPVQMPAGEVYNALQTGLIDGLITGPSAIADFKFDEVADSYTVGAPLGRISFYVVMNQARLEGLPEAERAAVEAHGYRVLSESAENGWIAKGQEAMAAVEAAGDNTVVSLSAEEAQAFADVLTPVADAVVAEIGGEAVLAAMRGE